MHRLTPEGPPVAWGGATYGPDGTLYVTSGQGSNFARLGRLQSDGTFVALNPETNWDVEEFAVADDGRFIAYVVNENGISRLRLIDPATRRAPAERNHQRPVDRSLGTNCLYIGKRDIAGRCLRPRSLDNGRDAVDA